MCSRADETINHIVSECPKLAQREYKKGMIGSEGDGTVNSQKKE